jgi:arylsulfatase A-like enzyme
MCKNGGDLLNKPNIIFIYADDLGMGLLGCYGQKSIPTPNIDRLAHEGIKFERAYGTAFCAPARASLLCGIHDAHAGRWSFTKGGIYLDVEPGSEGLESLIESLNNTGIQHRAGDVYLATVAKQAGYATGEIGKLEWGFATTPQQMEQHGWDYHYGYYDHGMCHGFYPPYLFENGKTVQIEGNTHKHCGKGPNRDKYTEELVHDMSGRQVYSQDLFDEKIAQFIGRHKDEPFFLYHPSQLPHGPTFFHEIYPEIEAMSHLNRIEKEYASMVVRLDKTVGLILDELEKWSLLDNTLIIFSADNGHEPQYYATEGRSSVSHTLDGRKLSIVDQPYRTEDCGDVFNGNLGLAGTKRTNWEGGARVPLIVRWPGVVQDGRTSSQLVSNYDHLGLIADILGVAIPEDKDSLSYLPLLQGKDEAPEHDYIVYASFNGPALVTKDGWKLRVILKLDQAIDYSGFGDDLDAYNAKTGPIYQLYDLNVDIEERENLAERHPEKVKQLLGCLLKECDGNLVHGTPNAHFAFTSV